MGDVPRNRGSSLPRPRPTLSDLNQKLEDLTTRFTREEENTTQLYKDHTILHKKNKQLSDDILKLRTASTAISENYRELKKDHARLLDDHTKLKTEYNNLLKDHSDDQEKVKVCLQKLSDVRLYLDNFQEEHDNVVTEQNKLKEEIKDIRADQQIEKNIRTEQQTKIDNIIADQQTQVSSMNEVFAQTSDAAANEITSLREEMASLSRDVANVMDTISAQQGHTELQTLQADLSQLKEDNNKVQTEVAKIQEDCNRLMTEQNNMKTEMDHLETNQAKLTTDMDRIPTDQKSFQADMAKLQKDHVDTVLAKQRQLQQNQDTLTSDVGTVKTDVEQMKTSLEEALNKTSLDITAMETRLEKARQLFDVGGLKNERTRRGQAMIFEKVILNDGGLYNEDTGIFNVPHAGLYFFTTTVTSNIKDTPVSGNITIDGVSHCGVNSADGMASGHVVVPLTPGQKVWVKANRPGNKYNISCCWFRGTLVLPY